MHLPSTIANRKGAVFVVGLLLLFGPRVLAGNEISEERVRSEERMRKDISRLASDAFEGRGVTTRGIERAADYIAAEFKSAGLQPGPNGSYFQHFTMPGARLEGRNSLRLSGPQGEEIELKLGDHFQPHGMAHTGQVEAPVVFVGYGITSSKEVGYDDYANVNVAGKVVIILRDTPNPGNLHVPFDGGKRREHASFTMKMQNALKHKAAAILFVNDRDTAKDGDELLEFGFTATAPSPSKLPAVHVRRSVVDRMVHASLGVHLRELEQEIDRTLKPRSASLPGWSVRLEVSVKRGTIDVKNVVGVLEGRGPLARETVVIGAHYDHLGYGGAASLAGMKKQSIHYGADDNGSGTTLLLELARRFGAQPGREGRRLVFLAFSAEESGLLGSVHYCKEPLFPLADTVAMVNMDMVGRLREDARGGWAKLLSLVSPVPAAVFPVLPLAHAREGLPKNNFLLPKNKLIVYGTGTAKTFNQLVDTLNDKHDFRLQKVPGGFGPSDHSSFYAKKIPVFFFFTGDHPDYHRPSDTAEKINIAGMRRIGDLVQELVTKLTTAPERPEYVKVAENRTPGPEGRIPRLGIRPDYGDAQEGVLLSGVSDDGPAAKAGIKEGDRIMTIGEKPVKDLKGYMALIATQKVGQPLELGIERNGKRLQVKVIPE